MIKTIMVIGLGGGLGAILRHMVAKTAVNFFGSYMAWGTLLVNLIGSFVIGFLVYMFVDKLQVSSLTKTFLIVGVLGGFTTFSSFSLAVMDLIFANDWGKAFVYIALNLVGSICLVFLGFFVAKLL